MKIYVVGNPLVIADSIPLTLLPSLRKAFPREHFEEADPNENFIPEEGSVIIDTVEGITKAQWFDDLDMFQTTKSVSPHDYDLGFHLLLLRKLHKIKTIRILGVPKESVTDEYADSVRALLRDVLG